MKKRLLVVLGVVVLIITLPVIFLKFAFGPLEESGTIDLERGVELLFDETYNGDFAGSFYDVEMILKMPEGRKYPLGSATFREQDWQKKIKSILIGNWVVVTLEVENLVQIKIMNIVTGQLNDTTLKPLELCHDLLYTQKHQDCPDRFYEGSSKVIDFSDNIIEVNYEYKAHAEYPTEILVEQKVVYEINSSLGTLQTKKVYERVAQ